MLDKGELFYLNFFSKFFDSNFRRHSNSGQRPAWLTSPTPDAKQV